MPEESPAAAPMIETLYETPYQNFRKRLAEIYSDTGDIGWIGRNAYVFDRCRKSESLAIAGSIGASICLKKAKKPPGDIDIVASSWNAATAFIDELQAKLLTYSEGYWSALVNSGTSFVPKPAIGHIRIKTAFWMPICVFVLPPDGFKSWFTSEAYPVQYLEPILEAKGVVERMREEMESEGEPGAGAIPATYRPEKL